MELLFALRMIMANVEQTNLRIMRMDPAAKETKRSKHEILAKLALGPLASKFKEWKARVFEEEDEHATDREVIVKRMDRLEDIMVNVANTVFEIKAQLDPALPEGVRPAAALPSRPEEGTHQEEGSPESATATNPKMADDKAWGKPATPVGDAETQKLSTATAIQQQNPQLSVVPPSSGVSESVGAFTRVSSKTWRGGRDCGDGKANGVTNGDGLSAPTQQPRSLQPLQRSMSRKQLLSEIEATTQLISRAKGSRANGLTDYSEYTEARTYDEVMRGSFRYAPEDPAPVTTASFRYGPADVSSAGYGGSRP